MTIAIGTRWRYASMALVWTVESIDTKRGREMATLKQEGGAMTQRVGVALLGDPRSGWLPA